MNFETPQSNKPAKKSPLQGSWRKTALAATLAAGVAACNTGPEKVYPGQDEPLTYADLEALNARLNEEYGIDNDDIDPKYRIFRQRAPLDSSSFKASMNASLKAYLDQFSNEKSKDRTKAKLLAGVQKAWPRVWKGRFNGSMSGQRNYLKPLTEDLEFRSYVYGLAEKWSEKYGVPTRLLIAQWLMESGLNPVAISSAGAIGLAQVKPEAAVEAGIFPLDAYFDIINLPKGKKKLVKNSAKIAKITKKLKEDQALNTEVGAALMRHLIDKYNGDMILAYASYNSGRMPIENMILDYVYQQKLKDYQKGKIKVPPKRDRRALFFNNETASAYLQANGVTAFTLLDRVSNFYPLNTYPFEVYVFDGLVEQALNLEPGDTELGPIVDDTPRVDTTVSRR